MSCVEADGSGSSVSFALSQFWNLALDLCEDKMLFKGEDCDVGFFFVGVEKWGEALDGPAVSEKGIWCVNKS